MNIHILSVICVYIDHEIRYKLVMNTSKMGTTFLD